MTSSPSTTRSGAYLDDGLRRVGADGNCCRCQDGLGENCELERGPTTRSSRTCALRVQATTEPKPILVGSRSAGNRAPWRTLRASASGGKGFWRKGEIAGQGRGQEAPSPETAPQSVRSLPRGIRDVARSRPAWGRRSLAIGRRAA